MKTNMKSRTQPQVYSTVQTWDGELSHPSRGPNLCKVRQMRKQPTISLSRQLIIAPVLAAHWNYLETDDAPEGAKDFIKKQLTPFRMHLLRTTFQGYIDFGWQPYEKIFKVCKDGMIGLKKLKPLLQRDTFILVDKRTGAYEGLKQSNTHILPEIVLTVPETLLVSLDVEGTDWYGHSIFESTEVAFDQYENSRKGADRYDKKVAGSHWIIHYPPGESDYNGQQDVSNDEIAHDILNKLEASGRIAVPKSLEAMIDEMSKAANSWEIELVSDVSNTTSNFIERLKYLDALIVRSFGVPERAVLEGSFGTKAEADSHGDAAVLNMDMRHRLAVVTYNQHLVNHLMRVNFGEEYEDTVYIEPAPLDASQRKLLATIYDRVLQSPGAGPEEIASIDSETLKSELGIPFLDDYEYVEQGIKDVLQSQGYRTGLREE